MTARNVIDALDAEWQRARRSRTYGEALARWAVTESALRFPSLDHLVAAVERRDLPPAATDRVLAALARRAPTDPAAARVLLQLLLPGCKRLVAQYRFLAEPAEVAAVVVAAAYDRIRTYPIERRPARIAANVLGDVRQRLLRSLGVRRDAVALDALPESALPPAPPAGDDGDALALLTWAVRSGHLDAPSARLIALTRVAGFGVGELARRAGTSGQTLRKRRSRAEARLRAVVAA